MRLFIACQLDRIIIQKIESFILPLKKTYKNIKWVTPKNIHLTLKFLGEVDIAFLNSIKEELANIKHSSFSLELVGLGGFPSLTNPKVLWIGIEGNLLLLTGLVRLIEDSMANIGFKREGRPYSPHLTTARLKKNIPNKLYHFLYNNRDMSFGRINISYFSLMESRLTYKGADYIELQKIALG